MRVYIAAPTHLDLTPLLTVLEEEEVGLAARAELLEPPPGGRRAVDAVVAILEDSSSIDRENILVECGICVGRNIPLLVLVEDHGPQILFGRAQVVSLNGAVLRIDALRFHVGLFLKRAQLGMPGPDGGREPNVRDLDLADFRRRLNALHELDSSGPGFRYQAYEQWVRDLLEAAGADVSSPEDKGDRGFDLAAAVPSLPSYFGPLMVEVKVATKGGVLFDAALRLAHRVSTENFGLGLLLFDDAKVSVSPEIKTIPRVISLGFSQLLDALGHDSLAKVVTRARNEAVHGL